MASASLHILNIFVRHGAEKYTGALEVLRDYYRSRLPAALRTLVVVDNSLDDAFTERMPDGSLVIGGSNADWEFSAWNTALAHCREELVRYDYVHLVTSAFGELYTAYIGRIDQSLLRAVCGRDVAVGHVDAYGHPVRLLGRTSQAWLRSSFVFVPPAALRRLGSFVSITDRDDWFSGDPAAPFRADAPLSDGFRANIIGWLTGEGTGQGTAWHSRFTLSRETLGFFEAKARAILNEHALSMRLYGQGTALVDATWLASSLANQRWGGLPPKTIPDWREQLVERRPFI